MFSILRNTLSRFWSCFLSFLESVMSDKKPDEGEKTISRMIAQAQAAGVKVETTTLLIPDLPTTDRDRILGTYMNGVSQLEAALQGLLWKLMHTDLPTTRCVFTMLGFRQLDDLLPALGRIALTDDDHKKLTSLCRRLRKTAIKRNRIVHGSWLKELSVGSDCGKPNVEKAIWARSFTPTDPQTESRIHSDPKIKAKYYFSLDDIQQITKDTRALTVDFFEFQKGLTYVPDPPAGRVTAKPLKEPPDTTQ